MICCKPYIASLICLRATISQSPEGTLRTYGFVLRDTKNSLRPVVESRTEHFVIER
jgi:hypothetical protein